MHTTIANMVTLSAAAVATSASLVFSQIDPETFSEKGVTYTILLILLTGIWKGSKNLAFRVFDKDEGILPLAVNRHFEAVGKLVNQSEVQTECLTQVAAVQQDMNEDHKRFTNATHQTAETLRAMADKLDSQEAREKAGKILEALEGR